MSTENEDVLNPEIDDALEGEDNDIEVVVDTGDEPEAEAPGDEPEAEAPGDEPEAEAPSEEPEAEAPSEEPVSEDDAELAAMPTKFKKRLEREIRLRDQIRGERDQIKNIALQAATLAKNKEDEIVSLKKQNAAIQRQFAETLDYAYERDIASKAMELRRAREDNNYDVELRLQGELDTLRFQHNQIKQVKTTLPDPEKITSAPQQQQSAPQQQQWQQRPPPAPQAVSWINTNKSWFNTPKFSGHTAFVLAEDQKLAAEGYDKNTQEYYTELDRRIDAAFPSLRKKGVKTSSPVAPAANTPASSSSSKVIKLNKSDLANMRRYGLDPANKEHLREYARSKRAA